MGLFGSSLGMRTHVVKLNETLGDIAKLWYGDENLFAYIYKANSHYIYDINNLPVGQRIVIPHLPVKKALEEMVEGHFGTAR